MEQPVKEHEMLPNFTLEAVDGSLVDSTDYKGKTDLVVIFFDPKCEGCGQFLCEISERYEEYLEANAAVIAIGEGSMSDVKTAVHSMNLPFAVLADHDGRVGGRFNASLPSAFVTDRYGEVREVQHGAETRRFPNQDSMLTRIELNELECPECGAPTWPS